MDRRRFLAGSLAFVAAAGLPIAKRKKQNTPAIYRTSLIANTPGQTEYELSIYHNTVTNFANASDDFKNVILTVRYFKTSDTYTPTTYGEFSYKIKSVLVKDNLYEIVTKFNKKISGDHKLPKDFPKDLKLRMQLNTYAKVLGKKDTELLIIPYPKTTSYDDDDMGCFLTTACVHHKKLADDCKELNTLRDLRDNFMMTNDEGREIVRNYKQIGPRLIQSINGFENREEIYEYMYQQLVLPSVKMVEEGKKAQAVEYYKDFVNGLTAKYL